MNTNPDTTPKSNVNKHIVAAFSIALAITFALIAYLLFALAQSRANERFLDAARNQHFIESHTNGTNNNININSTNQIK